MGRAYDAGAGGARAADAAAGCVAAAGSADRAGAADAAAPAGSDPGIEAAFAYRASSAAT